MDTLLHTPDGVRDIYGRECAAKNIIEERILNELSLFGYNRIETPTFEFFELFNKERGSVSSREMYKFFDRDNNTLVLRPDITPAIARCVAKFYMEETLPVRLCYLGNTFNNNINYKGRLKESTQTGAELIGDNSADADAEMIMLAIRCLLSAGLTNFQVELGQADFYRGLLEEAGLTAEQDRNLRELIENKNTFGVEEFADANIRIPKLQEIFLRLPELYGDIDLIKDVKKLTDNRKSLRAIERLEKVHEILSVYGLSRYVSYDLGMLSQFNYYTGIIFKAYSYGTGDYILNGGRYDRLLMQFGKDTPAVGFGITIDSLLSAMLGQKIEVPVKEIAALVVYGKKGTARAAELITGMRDQGKRVAALLKKSGISEKEYREYAKANGMKEVIFIK